MTRASSSIMIALCLCAVASSARAQEAPQADAVVLFEQSADAYRAGRFSHAASLLEEAYALWPDPVLVYNLGRAYEGAGQLAEARDAYVRYLASGAPDDAADVRARLRALDSTSTTDSSPGAVDDAPDASAAAQPPPASSEGLERWAPWLTAGGSALVAVIGVGLIVGGAERVSVAQSEPVHLDASRALDDARALTTSGDVLLTLGLVGAAAGATWGLLSMLGVLGGENSQDRAALHVGIASATWRLRW